MTDEHPMATAKNERGFTLIEILLAVAITATIMMTVGTTFHVMLNARDVVEELGESTEAGPRILNLIERDLRGLWTFNIKNNAVFKGTQSNVNGREANRMDFLTTTDAVGSVLDLRNEPQKPSLCEVGYWFKPNPKFRDVFEMWRREDPMVDGDLTTQGSFQLVHDRVKSFKVRYYDTLGYEAEELLEWDTSREDRLPKRLKIEFTIERRRSSRNIVSDVEVDDFEGAEKTYVRHFVFDRRLDDILKADTARIPVFPTEPQPEQGNGPAGPAGGPAGPAGPGGPVSQGRGTTQRTIGAGDIEKSAGDAGGRGTATGTRPPGGNFPRPSNGGSNPRPPSGGGLPPGLPPGFNWGQFFPGAGGGGGAGGLFGGR